MAFVKLLLDHNYGNYSYQDSSNVAMCILGLFFTDDVGYDYNSGFKEWSLNDNWDGPCSGNTTQLEKDGNDILLTDLYSEEKIPTILRIPRQQFIKLFNDWEQKVCKFKPKEVVIKYKNDEYIFETKD